MRIDSRVDNEVTGEPVLSRRPARPIAGDFPADDVALPIVWDEGIGLVRTSIRP